MSAKLICSFAFLSAYQRKCESSWQTDCIRSIPGRKYTAPDRLTIPTVTWYRNRPHIRSTRLALYDQTSLQYIRLPQSATARLSCGVILLLM